ncbi:MAG: ADP-ribosylglycohydrolase family protein [Sphaerochaeta sp.]|nr:ADP-ribosylglycohydrolase family protein [Sphaerochaeta sp.]
MKVTVDYRKQVYAGWVGKCIGVRFGAPIENWTYEEIQQALGEVTDYLPLPPGKLFKPDDDTAFPMILVRALADWGPDVSAQQFGETMLNYLGEERGTLWWGGYGISTEHTAYLNLAHGIPAPLSGSSALNGRSLAEQIGGQIFSDLWGLVVPNDVEKAAHYAELATSISHDGSAIHGSRFIAALASAAFSFETIQALIETALTTIPADSEYAHVVRDMVRYHQENPASWRDAFLYLKAHWGYDKYSGVVPIIPNAGVIVLALLYGAGDFSRTIEIGNMCGWDTDCNVGNLGAIMGVAVGLGGIESRWRIPMADELVTAGLNGEENYTDITTCADIIADAGEAVRGVMNTRSPYRYHFSHPGSTQGFRMGGKVIQLHTIGKGDPYFGGEGGLCATIKKLGKKSQATWYVKTNCSTKELSANYYGATFSPKLYPGQRIAASLYLPEGSPTTLIGALCYRKSTDGARVQQKGVALQPGKRTSLALQIPHLEDTTIEEVGIIVHNIGEGLVNASVVLEYLTWDGEPHYSQRFDKARHDGAMIAGWTSWRGFWRLEDGVAAGSGPSQGEQYTGSLAWRDYQISATLTPRLGPFHGVMARVQGARRSYLFALAEGQQAVLYKKIEGRLIELSSIAFAWEHGKTYELSLVVQGATIAASIDRAAVLQIDDLESPHLNGRIGLAFGAGGRTDFHGVCVQPL